MKRSVLGLAIVAACLVPAAAAAQEAGKIGVTMGFPASVGVIWHASEKFAVRPEFSFSQSSVELSLSESDRTTVGVGLSALFYTKKWDNAAMYFSPRFAWSHSTAETRTDFDDFPPVIFIESIDTERESSANSYAYSGSVGAQGWIGRRFSVFGEVGLEYMTGSAETDSFPSSDSSVKGFNLRSGVGAVLYF